MYISDVIEQAKALHPSEYTVPEYLRWCDELSSDIRKNYCFVYDKITVHSPEILLPEGVSVNEISKITADGKELKKTDLRDFGIEYEYGLQGRTIKKTDGTASDFEIVYAVPHTPTRYINEDGTAVFSGNSFSCGSPVFVTGDTVKITDGDEAYTVHITDVDDGVFFYSGAEIPEGERQVHFYREITEKTLIPAPYDTAYMDYVNAKVSMYQGDSAAYRTFTEQYNEKMKDYRMYLTRNMPRIKSRFKNWY
ncbi:MAG: hypothetical protein IJ300_06350 [Clostridia bacterium]|nr:hypothetical protein [Clostridia bacterium]